MPIGLVKGPSHSPNKRLSMDKLAKKSGITNIRVNWCCRFLLASREDSPVLQVSQLAVCLPRWCACALSPWVEWTSATGYSLQFKVSTVLHIQFCVWERTSAVLSEKIKKLVDQKSDMSSSQIGSEQRPIQPLFNCEEKGRTLTSSWVSIV